MNLTENINSKRILNLTYENVKYHKKIYVDDDSFLKLSVKYLNDL